MLLATQVICILFGLFFLISGWLKVIGNAHMVKEFQKFNYPQWLRVVAGLIELVAAPMMLTVIWLPVLAATGSLIMCPVMAGATYTNFVKRPASFGWGTLVILALCAIPVAVYAQDIIALLLTFVPA